MIKLSKIAEAGTRIGVDREHQHSMQQYKYYDIFLRLIKKKCKQIINIYENSEEKYIFRGIKRGHDNILRIKIRQDRSPGYLHETMHEITNETIIKLGGVAHRGNSIFCSTNLNTASSWGNTYVVFPIDGFDVTYFKNLDSNYMYNDLSSLWQKWEKEISENKKSLKIFKNEVKKLLIKKGISFDVKKMVGLKHREYLISDDFYYAINISNNISDVKLLLRDLDKIK